MSDQFQRLKAALADRYAIERELGSGGMATVYLAEDLRHHRKVAVKVLRPELAESVGPDRFVREIEIAAGLHHPHILPLYDSGEADGFLFYVMPFVEGESLRDRLSREGELPIADAVRILREVADALAKAHAQGVVHRDIKPDNVLLADRHAAVADFGVAKAVSEATGPHGITTAGVALGTPAYMAPEQASADPHIDHRADIYAFGVLAYEMLTGQPPFTGATSQQVLAAHVTETPTPVTDRRAAVPEALARLVMQALEKKPADRWQSGDELVSALETLATPSGGMTPTTARPAVAAYPTRKKVMGGAAIFAAVALLAVFIGLAISERGAVLDVDPQLVAVLPFRVSGTGDELGNMREGMVDLMATYLTGEGGTARSADPGTVIGAWRDRVSSEDADLPAEEARALARELGAGRVLIGSVVGSESNIVLRGSLHRTQGSEAPIQASVEGPADSLLALLPRFVGQLVAQSAGLASDQSASLTTNSLPAVRAYLAGQAEYRRGEFGEAVNRFTEALETDSNFALAGVGLLTANGWGGGATGRMQRIAQRAAWENRERLTTKDRALVVAVIGPSGMYPDDRLSTLRGREQAVRIAGDRADAWYFLGDAYFHDGALLEIDDAFPRAEEALTRAIGRDSLDVGVIQHLMLLAADRGDTAQVRRWWPLLRQAAKDSAGTTNWNWFPAVVLGDTAVRNAVLGNIEAGQVGGGSAFLLPFMRRHAGETAELLSRLEARPGGRNDRTAVLQAFVALDRGRPTEASDAFRKISNEVDGTIVLSALFWGGDSIEGARAAERLSDTVEERGWFETAVSDLCARTLWRVGQGDSGGVASAIRRLRESAANRDPSWPPTPNLVCADLLEASHAQLTNQPNARDLVDQLDRMLARGPYRQLGWENIATARLLEHEGEYTRAARVARRHPLFIAYTPFYSTHLWESGRLADLAGDKEAAIEAYARYLELRSDVEPSVQPEVDEVRQALARMTGETK